MADVKERTSIERSLQLALDACLALGAFVAGLTGAVHHAVSEAMPPVDAARRIQLLARSCLAHPAAHGRAFFWNAELSTQAESADHSLACVVIPVWAGTTQVGLLGIVDTWLPEPDPEQREGLAAIAADLAVVLSGEVASPRVGSLSLAEGAGAGSGSGSDSGAPARSDPLVSAHTGDAELMRAVFQALPDAVVVSRAHPAGPAVVLANQAFSALCGQAPGELVGRDLRTILVTDPLGSAVPTTLMPGSIAGGVARSSAVRRMVVPADSDPVHVTAHEIPISGEVFGDCTVFVVRRRPGPLEGGTAPIGTTELLECLEDGVMCLDASGRVVLANAAADSMHGLGADRTLAGSPIPMASPLRSEDGHVLAHDDHPGLRAIREHRPCTAQLTIGEEGSGQRHITVTARPFTIEGEEDGALVVLHDSTAEWNEQQRLSHYALYDPLTALANRYLLAEEVRRMLQSLDRRGGSVALIYLDLDDFKRINDEHGHEMGDEVLGAVARRLRGAVRADDVVARLGGDEFVIAHASEEDAPDGDLVVSRLRKVLSAPFRVRGQAFDVGASIGWVSTDRGEVGPDALLARADRAMYRHKRDRAMARRVVP